MPKKTSREKLLLALLPAAIVLAAYAFLFALPAQQKHQKKLAELELARQASVSDSAAELSRSNLELAQSGMSRLNEQIRNDRDKIALMGKHWSSGDVRLPTVQQVTELLQQFNLSIVSQDFEKEPVLSEYLKDLETIVKRHSIGEENLAYWQIELAGSYGDMMKFLQEIKTSGMRTFPVTLSMKSSESGDGVHTWKVVFVV